MTILPEVRGGVVEELLALAEQLCGESEVTLATSDESEHVEADREPTLGPTLTLAAPKGTPREACRLGQLSHAEVVVRQIPQDRRDHVDESDLFGQSEGLEGQGQVLANLLDVLVGAH